MPDLRASARLSPTSHRSARRRRPWASTCAFGSAVGLVAVSLTTGTASAAATPVLLGTVSPLAVLAATTVTNTGPSVLHGDLGVSPGLAVTGFPPGLVDGATRLGDAVAAKAQDDLTTAYDAAAGQARDTTVSADLGGQVFRPGVHGSGSSLGLTGTVTLDAQGDPGAVFVFQAGSTLTTAAASRVLLVNGASSCNVFWQVGSSATLGAGTAFAGSLLVLVSASLGNSVTVDGRVLARTGAVTLDADVVTRPVCATSTPGGTTPTTTTPTTTAPTTTAPTTTTPTTSAPTTTTPTTTPTTTTPTTTGPATTPPAPDPTPTAPAGRAPTGSSGTLTGAPTGTTTGRTTTARTTTGSTTTGPTTTGSTTSGSTTSGVTTRTTAGGTTDQRLTDGPAVTGGRSVVPRGAPATGGGGTAPAAGSPLVAAGLLALLTAAAVAGLVGPRQAPARHRSS